MSPAPGAVHAAIVDGPIEVDPILAVLEEPASGAVTLFLGRVRNIHQGRNVESIHYQAYREMAEPVLRAIAQETLERFPVGRIALVHRVGHLQVGEVSVLVAVASEHRAEAFAACRHGIDRIKEDVPIWKKEVFIDGTSEWVDARTDCGSSHPG